MRLRVSRRRLLVAVGWSALASLVAACGAAIGTPAPSGAPAGSGSTPPPPEPTPDATPGGTPEPSATPGMDPEVLRRRVARMLMVGFRGRTPDEARATIEAIRDRGLGGVILYDVDLETGGPRNIESRAQVRALVAALRGATTLPLLVAIDEEGGRVSRLTEEHGFPPTRSAAELGATGDPAESRAAGQAIGTTLADLGINLDLAPVVDLAVNPSSPAIGALERSFGPDPGTVIAHAGAFLEGLHLAGAAGAIKHFPGHGSATGDTHEGWVDVTATWTDAELEPFAALTSDGLADAVMTAHVFNATLDSDLPATLSRATVTGLLREQLGFDGVVISDDLQMGALRDRFDDRTIVELAVEAGVDVLLFSNQLEPDADVVHRTVETIAALVEDGRVPFARIQASLDRIERLARLFAPPE